jgi:hypothetical protein
MEQSKHTCLTITKYQKEVYYTGIKLFNHLPPEIKSLNYDIKVFKPALKDYLLSHSYSVEDFAFVEFSYLYVTRTLK